MRKTLTTAAILAATSVFAMSCAPGPITPEVLRNTPPIAAKEISKSPERTANCIVSLMDEVGTMVNHLRYRDNSASILSYNKGDDVVYAGAVTDRLFVGPTGLLSVVEVKATESGSLATFHPADRGGYKPLGPFDPVGKDEYEREPWLAREMSDIFEYCAES